MSLGLGSNLSKSGLVTPGIVSSSLVLKHKYDAASVVPISDGAVDLNGTSDYVSTSFMPDYIHTNATIAFWINMKDFSSDQYMGSHNNKRWYFGFSSSQMFFGVANAHNGSSLITISPSVSAGEWFHYCVTAIDGTATGYINGIPQGTLSYTQSSSTNPDTGFTIGVQNQSGGSFGGYMNAYICNLGQWSTGLTQAQIKSIMNKNYEGLSDSEKTNLEAWWNLDSTLGGSGGTSVVVNNHDNTLGEELITGFVNGSTYVFDTLTTSGRDISAAVETSGDWAGAVSNSLNLVEGEIYKCTFNLTYNSGTDTVRVILVNAANGAATTVIDAPYYTNTNGAHEAYFRVKTTDSESFLQIGTWHSSDVVNFNMTDISLKRLGGNSGKLS